MRSPLEKRHEESPKVRAPCMFSQVRYGMTMPLMIPLNPHSRPYESVSGTLTLKCPLEARQGGVYWVRYTCTSSIQEAETGGSCVLGWPGLQHQEPVFEKERYFSTMTVSHSLERGSTEHRGTQGFISFFPCGCNKISDRNNKWCAYFCLRFEVEEPAWGESGCLSNTILTQGTRRSPETMAYVKPMVKWIKDLKWQLELPRPLKFGFCFSGALCPTITPCLLTNKVGVCRRKMWGWPADRQWWRG